MRPWITGLIIAIIFFSGYLANAMTSETGPETDQPDSVWDFLGIAPERISPGDWISENQIHVYQDHVRIDISNPEWASFTNTNSMDPIIDEKCHAIEIVPTNPDQINIGDIVSYRNGDDTIIHRVIGKGNDEVGPFFIMKGDNLAIRDPGKVRFHEVERILVAIIY